MPGKPLKEVLGRPLLGYLMERLKRVKLSQTLVIATTENEKDLPIAALAEEEKVRCIRGSVEDVLSRYLLAAHAAKADVIVRVTGDCPVIDPQVIDQAIGLFLKSAPQADYVSNTIKRTFPRGMDVEVFSRDALEQAAKLAKTLPEREHVTPFIYHHPELFRIVPFCYKEDLSRFRWTVDTPEDFEVIQKIIESLYPKNPRFGLEDMIRLMDVHPEWVKINAKVMQKNDFV